MAILNNCLNFVQNLLQQECVLCGAGVRNQNLCLACCEHLPYLRKPCCRLCALPIPDGEVCGACLTDPPAFNSTHAAFSYSFPVDVLIQALKYQGNLALAPILAAELLHKADGHLIALSLYHSPPKGYANAVLIRLWKSPESSRKIRASACFRMPAAELSTIHRRPDCPGRNAPRMSAAFSGAMWICAGK